MGEWTWPKGRRFSLGDSQLDRFSDLAIYFSDQAGGLLQQAGFYGGDEIKRGVSVEIALRPSYKHQVDLRALLLDHRTTLLLSRGNSEAW